MAVGRKRHTRYGLCMASELKNSFSRLNIPRSHCCVGASSEDVTTVGKEYQAVINSRRLPTATSWCHGCCLQEYALSPLNSLYFCLEVEIGGQHNDVANGNPARPCQHEHQHTGHLACFDRVLSATSETDVTGDSEKFGRNIGRKQ